MFPPFARLVAPLRHWHLGDGEENAETLNVTEKPGHALVLDGCVTMLTVLLTPRRALLLVALPHALVTTQLYELLASRLETGLMVRVALVAPEILPPLARSVIPRRHWYDNGPVPEATTEK